MTDLTPVVVGGLLAVGGGLVGALIASRREHARWLREKRFDIYMLLLAQVDKVIQMVRDVRTTALTPAKATAVREQGQSVLLAMDKAAAELSVLAQFHAGQAATDLVNAVSNWSAKPETGEAAVDKARGAYVAAIRKDIGIPSAPWLVRQTEIWKVKRQIAIVKRKSTEARTRGRQGSNAK